MGPKGLSCTRASVAVTAGASRLGAETPVLGSLGIGCEFFFFIGRWGRGMAAVLWVLHGPDSRVSVANLIVFALA